MASLFNLMFSSSANILTAFSHIFVSFFAAVLVQSHRRNDPNNAFAMLQYCKNILKNGKFLLMIYINMDCRAVRYAVYMYVYIDMSPFLICVRDKVT